MSMLSAQCDELRIMANISELPDGVRLALRQAADTIWELRCKLNDEQDENTRLRSYLTDAAENARLIMGENAKLRRDLEEANSQAEEVCIENAKLRELAERAWKTAERLCQAFDGPCKDDGVTIVKPCPMGERDEECVYGQLQRELRECGVEVD